MKRYYSYLESAKQLLCLYEGEEPFAAFLKKFFSQHRKYGSKDRKQISQLCYCYFRLGKSLLEIPVRERILIGLFLCSTESNEILAQTKPEWNDKINLPLVKKLSVINYPLLVPDVFPWQNELSNGIDYQKFSESLFVQPDLFLRLRPGKENVVKQKLLTAGLEFQELSQSCLSLANSSRVEDVIDLNREAVVQDFNSQQVGEYFKSAISNLQSKIIAWDCCAGSGGKSLLLYDLNCNIDLTVSDVRESILINLKKRFERAGIKKYKSFVADLTQSDPPFSLRNSRFDLIICDAPCTGSGTWSRTPEQLYYFDEKKIDHYASLQKKIVSNVISNLNENGFLVYITCSVFKKENEEVAEFITRQLKLELIKMHAWMRRSEGELIKGYDKKADTMFVALFKRS